MVSKRLDLTCADVLYNFLWGLYGVLMRKFILILIGLGAGMWLFLTWLQGVIATYQDSMNGILY